jgi:protein phosphatase
MTATLKVWAATDVGCVRRQNEDALCIGTQVVSQTEHWSGHAELGGDSPRVVAVIDGMGGHRGGAVASQIVAEAMVSPPLCDEPSTTAAEDWLNQINQRLHEHADTRPELCGMGATVAALWFGRRTGLCLNVGDAKAYRVQDGFLSMRSDDHAVTLPNGQHGLIQSLGGTEERQHIRPAFREERLGDGRRYLLCSDGLVNEVELDELERLMELPPAGALAAMLEAARKNGGRDNITIAIVEVQTNGEP